MKSRNDIQGEYDRRMTQHISLKLNKKTDAVLIKWLEGQGNKQGAIKKVLYKHIIKDKKIEKGPKGRIIRDKE